jgi:hypothetical protein
MDDYTILKRIIDAKEIAPVIVNPESKFVVITYWWGRGNNNRNIARPCMEFYEQLLSKPFNYLFNLDMKNSLNIFASFDSIETIKTWINSIDELTQFYGKKTLEYVKLRRVEEQHEDFNISKETHKEMYEWFKSVIIENVATMVFNNLHMVRRIFRMVSQTRNVNKRIKNVRTTRNNKLALVKNQQIRKIKTSEYEADLKRAINRFVADVFEKHLMYERYITYDKMIEQWIARCTEAGCNYMAVEYPQFAEKGGYQLAINAKPLFIQKAVNSCGGRAVVYIDGDMTINRYPAIFDMDDVDFMARGWNMDPRTNESYLDDNIMVDPYVFETSGGIMYFSNSIESRNLLDGWVTESAKPYQQGRADDRILSLVFNVRKLLAPMKIIQLPIEYLWLTLFYKYYILPEDMSVDKIYVEHPHCLTSEDTAASSGASSNRSAKFQSAIPDTYPRSQMLYERAMFPSKEIVEGFRPWLNYMNRATYNESVEDFDEELVGEQPFYIVPYDNGFGKLNPIYEENMKQSQTSTEHTLYPELENTHVVSNLDIPNILNSLLSGHNVIYIPGESDAIYVENIKTIVSKNNRLELLFWDRNIDFDDHTIFSYVIDINKPIFIRSGNPILNMMLALTNSMIAPLTNNNAAYQQMRSMFSETPKSSFETILKNSYQFVSRIRIHVMKNIRPVGGGGIRRRGYVGGAIDRNTDDALEFLYPATPLAQVNGRRTMRKRGGRRLTQRRRV